MMPDEFLIRALLAASGVALAAGPLGCFVVWRRMAYFGDATSHAAILGVALSLAFSISVFAGILAVALAMALLVSAFARRDWAMDTTLGVLAHSALALGLVAVSFQHGTRVDLASYLFGDVLAVTWGEVALIWGGAGLVLALLIWRWNRLLTATLNEDLAQASGIDPGRERLVLVLALALVVALAIKVVGALLITAMLLIPAAAARSLARTPEAMACGAVLAGGLAALGGLGLSVWQDTPTGPSIVSVAFGLFMLAVLAGSALRRTAQKTPTPAPPPQAGEG